MLAMDVWCFSKSTARIDLEKHQTRLHYWGISLCNFGESPLQFWVFLLYTKHFDLQLHQLTCSCSHSACLSVHGYYRRTVKLSSGAIRLRVCRVKCSECGATHALLLSSMVPYSQIPLSDQQRICKDYEEDRDLCMVCEGNPSIDENNVKSILRNYRLCWREKLRSLKIPLFPLADLILSCFSDYSSQFLQIHRRVNKLFSYTT